MTLVDDILNLFEKPSETNDFDAIKISLASPETIRSWSYGEVTKPETINYRTFKPERGGLFCQKIFGPVKDWECACGKYKRMKHRGIVCEKCGVEVIQSKVRRERLAHIELACPVSHVWFFKGLPSRIGHMLDMSLRDLERILYFQNYIMVDPGESGVEPGTILDEDEYADLRSKFGSKFYAGMGAEAIRDLLAQVDVDALARKLREDIRGASSTQKIKKLTKRLKVVDAFRKSGNRPEWMVLEVIPVIPPELRPLVPLDGGRFAISDLNDLYRRVINRNNRLKRLKELKAPEVIIRNEKRMLQEAVDALFDNGRRGRTLKGSNNRPLRSLSDMLKGKQGRFRQNLLGKRVDYSGRSVIVIGPDLKLNQCGLPKEMALELFKPFIFNKLEARGHVTTIKSAKKLVEQRTPLVWEILEEVIQEHPVMLNRAPTLHRLGIQAFQPLLIEGKAIQIHPLVCAAFNADFDGDQMAVHVPLSTEAQVEVKALIMASNNLLSPANGRPITVPSQDIVLGLYYMTLMRKGEKGEGKIFPDVGMVRSAYDHEIVGLGAAIKVRIGGKLVDTTVGRVLFNEILPEGMPFFNRQADGKSLRILVSDCHYRFGNKPTVELLDNLKSLGFKTATQAGISICVDDMRSPASKSTIINDALAKVIDVEEEHKMGVITRGERYNKIVDIWSSVTERVADEMFKGLEKGQGDVMDPLTGEKQAQRFNPIFMMADSGARGSKAQIRQLAGMRGLMAKPSGEIIETPITANFREGLTVLQYFISTHGARKGLADTALKTANSGYLTRRLVDVAQDVIINELDCGTLDGIYVEPIYEGGDIIEPVKDRILGRVSMEDMRNPRTGALVCAKGSLIEEVLAQAIDDADIKKVKIRSVLTCESKHGVCAACYGRNLATGKMVELGEAVGVIAAQSIGEPGTQLTMRTFHIGGAAQQIAEQTTLDSQGTGVVHYKGVQSVRNKMGNLIVMNRHAAIGVKYDDGREKEYSVVYGATLLVEDGDTVIEGQTLVKWDPFTNVILTDKSGTVKYLDIKEGVTMKEELDEVSHRTTKVISEYFGEDMHPILVIIPSEESKVSESYEVGKNAEVVVKRGQIVSPNTVLAIETTVTEGEEGTGKRKRRTSDSREILCTREGVVRSIKTKEGVIIVDEVLKYHMPFGAHLEVVDGDEVMAGDIMAKIPRETAKTKDITGGLPRVVELFEARKPRECATLTELTGRVRFAGFEKGMRKIVVESNEGVKREYFIPKGTHISVQDGDFIQAGEPLMDGSADPHDILRIKGIKELQKYLVNEIQEVYRLQGVTINDKHIEAIVRQMLRMVKVTDAGDTFFLPDSQVDKFSYAAENERLRKENPDGKAATSEPLLLGITKASLSTESFLSAASFQETTRILTEAATQGKMDFMRGLKENIVVGRLIPAGSGFTNYYRTRLTTKTRKMVFETEELPPAEEGEEDFDIAVEPVVEGA